jgi:hypothetical protein
MICSSTQCLFCLGDTRLPHESRIFCFSRPRKAREHVERQHLRPHYPAGPVARGGCGRHKHTGPVNGAQVVQVSISQDSPLIRRPQKELKRFRKGFRRAGETQRVTVTMAKSMRQASFTGLGISGSRNRAATRCWLVKISLTSTFFI